MALLLPNSGTLVLHIPKTGGTWVTAALQRAGVEVETVSPTLAASTRHGLPGHLPRDGVHRIAAFVRHPVSWYESWWKFQAESWQHFETGVWHPQHVLQQCDDDDFTEFVRNVMKHEPAYVTRMYEWYLGPVASPFHTPTWVGRYERLADSLVEMLDAFGESFDEPKLRETPPQNVSPARAGEPRWAEFVRDAVERVEAPAIRRFYPEGIP